MKKILVYNQHRNEALKQWLKTSSNGKKAWLIQKWRDWVYVTVACITGTDSWVNDPWCSLQCCINIRSLLVKPANPKVTQAKRDSRRSPVQPPAPPGFHQTPCDDFPIKEEFLMLQTVFVTSPSTAALRGAWLCPLFIRLSGNWRQHDHLP